MTPSLKFWMIPLLLGSIPILIAVIAWMKRRKKYAGIAKDNTFRVRYCTSERYSKWLKFYPWEGVGLLSLEQGVLTFEGHPNNGGIFITRSTIKDLQQFGRQQWFRNGLLPWMKLTSDNSELYLCAESGPLIFGASSKNQNIIISLHAQDNETQAKSNQ